MTFDVSLTFFLDSSILSDDSNLDIPGFNLVRADRPVLAKPEMFIYYRKY